MGCFRTILAPLTLFAAIASAPAARGGEGAKIAEAVGVALETGDRARLTDLFAGDRKISFSLHRIADIEGFAGAGPVVEAFCRYLSARNDVRFEGEHAERKGDGDPVRV